MLELWLLEHQTLVYHSLSHLHFGKFRLFSAVTVQTKSRLKKVLLSIDQSNRFLLTVFIELLNWFSVHTWGSTTWLWCRLMAFQGNCHQMNWENRCLAPVCVTLRKNMPRWRSDPGAMLYMVTWLPLTGTHIYLCIPQNKIRKFYIFSKDMDTTQLTEMCFLWNAQ